LVTPVQTTRGEIQPAKKIEPHVNTVEFKPVDKRAQILQAYLEKHNSPLAYHAHDFIEAADKNGIDWKLVPAIAGVESTFGKAIPGGYNAWGWGVYGDQAIYFSSWKNGINTVAEGLKTRYVDKGLTDPYAMNKVYAASTAWGGHVAFFLNDLDQFAKEYETLQSGRVSLPEKTAGASAKIALQSI
jgi:hypothetical protein